MTHTIHVGDCLEWLRSLPDNSVDSVVTDPPYGLGKEPDAREVLRAWLDGEEYKPGGSGFMGRAWDAFVPSPPVWAECLRVLKPGGHLLAFAGTRTYDWIVMGVRLAGFEVRDMVGWIYGCLSDDTEILVDGKWQHYSKAIEGRLALCYDAERDEYQWQPIRELVEYEYDDTAFSIRGDHTDQLVSRNHRCLVERGGGYTFTLAETLEREARVPVLESVQGLLEALPVPHEGTGSSQSVLQQGMRARAEAGTYATIRTQGAVHGMPGVRHDEVDAGFMGKAAKSCILQPIMPRQDDQRADSDCPQVQPNRDEVSRHRACDGAQSGVEGRCDVFPQTRQLQADQVRSMPAGVHADGAQGWVHHGAPADSRASYGPVSIENRSGASRESRSARQQSGESSGVFEQSGSQAVRGAGYTRSDLARVEPMHYRGKVWCIRVDSGAFVARRNGKVFVTGNSGFPKSLDVSKAIDSAAGAEREVVGEGQCGKSAGMKSLGASGFKGGGLFNITAPATEAARQWAGWGTAMKPAVEPVVMARKPLEGTVAQNVLKWGTGGINVDGCRIDAEKPIPAHHATNGAAGHTFGKRNEYVPGSAGTQFQTAGRWPANIIHDGSPEVLAVFPQADGRNPQGVKVNTKTPTGSPIGKVTYGGGHAESQTVVYNDTGSAARFYYAAKASRSEREHGLDALPRGIIDPTRELDSAGRDNPRSGAGRSGSGRANIHPTVKPVDLMRYLLRLVTPPGGLTIDPYAGSGTTGVAAVHEGFQFKGCELETPHALIAVTRIAQAVKDEREERELATMQQTLF